MQEPASAVFSAFNGLTVVVGFIKFRQNAPKSYPLHGILLFQFLVSWLNCRKLHNTLT